MATTTYTLHRLAHVRGSNLGSLTAQKRGNASLGQRVRDGQQRYAQGGHEPSEHDHVSGSESSNQRSRHQPCGEGTPNSEILRFWDSDLIPEWSAFGFWLVNQKATKLNVKSATRATVFRAVTELRWIVVQIYQLAGNCELRLTTQKSCVSVYTTKTRKQVNSPEKPKTADSTDTTSEVWLLLSPRSRLMSS